MKFYNAFGIKPTNSFTSAGSDYYIPNLKNNTEISLAYKAFEKSYGKTSEEIKKLVEIFNLVLTEKGYTEKYKENIPNLVHLYLAFYNSYLEQQKKESVIQSIFLFMAEFVVYDENRGVVGIKARPNDTLFINSGVKIALDTVLTDKVSPTAKTGVDILRALGIGVAGLYVNKSGMGNKGWDVRACLVDEDYAGFVHLSQAFTKEVIDNGQNIVYCGDKLTQMMLIPVFHDEYIDTTSDKYDKIMEKSKRGDKGFGSQDVKH